jgi:excinuclease UvrABC nuclease subunit
VSEGSPSHRHLFTHCAAFEPDADFEAFRKSIRAKWVVYLMADAADRPVQLLCVKNLRYSLERRLGPGDAEQAAAPNRRVNYREIVRRVYWRRVDSAFEADAIYLEAAREIFPQTYQGMVGFRPAWFVHVDPDARFPRYVKTIDLSERTGTYIGPLEDKRDAATLVEQVEDWFDLCRYYSTLIDSPNAKPCAYKEMGKCPSPCDGSISIDQYRRLVEWSLTTLVDPAEMIRQQTQRMQLASADLKFEAAAKIKAYIDELSTLGKGPYRHARRLQDFVYLSLQRGPREGTAKVFLITPGRIDEIAGLIQDPPRPAELLKLAFTLAAHHTGHSPALALATLPPPPPVIDTAGAERIGVVAHHLFLAKQTHGVFLPLEHIDEQSVSKAYRDLLKQKPQDQTEGEGVVKELQAL